MRPTPFFCLRVIPVRIGWFWGDPHINTLDGGQYTFNGYGEYTMMKIDFNGTSFDLQARTDLATRENGTTINATIFSAFVAKDHTGSTLQVELSRNKNKLYVRGDGLDITTEFENNPDFVRRTQNMVLSNDNGTVVASFIKSAITLKISLGVRFLALENMVDEKYSGQVTGLMGNFDGNSTNDFILPNGTTLYGNDVEKERDIYNNFGQLWSINSNTSLFHYDSGLSHDDYSHPDFVPIFIDEVPEEKVNKSKEACGGASATQACIFDFLATEDRSLAQSSGAEAEASTADTASLANSIPEITGDSRIHVEVNKSVEIAFNASDDGTFTYEILQEPPGFSFNNTTGIATWTPQNENLANISVTVVDDKGEQASPVDVTIVLCSGCSNNGKCNYTNTRSSGSDMFSYADCDCNIGYSGQNCENEIDGCEENPCIVGTNCTDLSPIEEVQFGRGYNCSRCPDGFYGTESKCEDINECNGTSTCDMNTEDCENTEGSYICNCKSGYRKPGSICQDIDECTDSTSGCEQKCENTPGSFNCSCVSGYTLNSDKKTCNSTGGKACGGLNCEYTCDDNESGQGEVCICPTGYTLKDSRNCTDIDECKVGGVCSQNCQNSVGSYTCSCYAGYSLNDDKTTCSECQAPNYGVDCKETCRCGKGMDRCDRVQGCVCKDGWTGSDCGQDVDECTDNPTICGDDKICKNLEGSYTCNCRAGYTKVNNDCVDINECDNVASNNCSSETTTCTNNNGSYSCTCKSGYKQVDNNPFECTDINECEVGSDGCSQNCQNKEGGFNCECEFGYTLDDDRKTCIEVRDICSLYPGLNCEYGCKQDSTNKSIGYCFCRSGYQLQAQDKRTCVDVNECNNDILNKCTYKDRCVNIEGSFNCSCPEGYSLQNDGRTCEECGGFTYGVDCKTPCDCGAGVDRCDNVRGCICKVGWAGSKCESDINECETGNPCTGANQVCKNSPGSYECGCALGYSKTPAETCEDIDECNVTNPCSQVCTNTPGSYSCGCNDGFILVGTSQCNDYDECSAPVSPCDQVCSNTVGSYKCSCNPGFLLNTTTRVTCYGKTECSNSTFNCSQKCGVNTDGSEYCFCNPGYKLNETDGTTCDDINDCSPNPCGETCEEKNSGPGYTCSCAEGKKLGVDERTCIVCESGKFGSNCAENCTCDEQNTESCDSVSGNCTCKTGWEGTTCSDDIDECQNATLCPTNSNCRNTNGSYSCICYPGYSLVGGQCVECSSTTYGQNCAESCTCDIRNSLTCDKRTGSCDCKLGWTNENCTENIHECSLNSTICGANANCTDTQGSFDCTCNTGFQKNSNGLCEDVNECIVGPINCDANAECNNTEGSFTCTCKSGFSGDGVSCTECSSTTFGQNCTESCTCDVNNTQRCDKQTGSCECKPGWANETCTEDIDECSLNSTICGANANCSNTQGSYDCTCDLGFKKNSNGLCEECSNTTFGQNCAESCACDINNAMTCDKQTGSCDCKPGWTNENCTEDIDECSLNSTICGTNTNCSNTQGSYDCTCDSGFQKNSTSLCEDVNECMVGLHNCDTNATCNNTVGSFTCTCISGFSGDGVSCTACNSTFFGTNCGSPCTCVMENTVDCLDNNGTCQCQPGWGGGNCDIDDNECTTNGHDCNLTVQRCENTGGSFSCICIYGNHSTGCIAKEDPYDTSQTNEVKIEVVLTLNETIDLSDYDAATRKMEEALVLYYNETIKVYFRVVILVIRTGSTIVEHEIVTNDTGTGSSQITQLVTSLPSAAPIKYDDKTLGFVSVQMVDTKGNEINITKETSGCEVYVLLNPCKQGEQCRASGNTYYCSLITDDSDDFQLIVGLGIGIPLFFLAVLVMAIVCVYWRRRKRRGGSLSSSEDNFENYQGGPGMYFSAGISTKIDSWGRHGTPYSPHFLEGTSTTQTGRRGKDGFDDFNNGREPNIYDNGVQSNFSWDFMYQALQPHEKFQIKRPEVRSQPLDTE